VKKLFYCSIAKLLKAEEDKIFQSFEIWFWKSFKIV